MPTQVQRTASARRRLIAAAIALVAEQGVGNTSVAAIGERAGMSRGAVNFHFGSKDDLLTAVAEEVTSDWEARAAKLRMPEGASLREGMSTMFEMHRKEIESDPDRFRIFAMLFFEALGPSPHLHEHFARLHRRLRARVVEVAQGMQASGLVRRDIDLEGYAMALVGAYRGIAFQFLLDPTAFSLKAAYDELCEAMTLRLAPAGAA